MATASYSARLPEELRGKLAAEARRMIAVHLAKGIAITLSVFVLCMVCSFMLDRYIVLPNVARTLLLAGSICATGAAAWIFAITPLRRRPGADSLAFAVEAVHPELSEGLASTVEILASDDSDDIKGSPELIGALVQGTLRKTRDIDFRTVIPFKTAQRAVAVAAIVLLGVSIYAWLQFRDFSQLFQRFLLADVPRLSDTRLVVQPGDASVLGGEAITIYAQASGRIPQQAYLSYRPDQGTRERLEMLSDEKGTFVITMGNQRQSFAYQVLAGDAVSKEYRVRVVPRPAIQALGLSYEYPAYTGQAPRQVTSTDGTISELEGTKVTLKVKSTQPLKEAHITFKSNSKSHAMDLAATEAAFSFTITANDVYLVRLVSVDGFENLPVPEYPIEALPDRKPIVKIERPGKNLTMSKPAVLDLLAAVRDDFAIASVQLVYKVAKGEPQSINLKLPEPKARSLVLPYAWDLAAIGAKAGDDIIYKVSAFDERGEPGRGDSSEFLVHIGLGEKTLARKEQMEAVDAARKDLHKLAEQIKQDAQKVERLKQAAQNQQAPWKPEDEKALREAQQQLDERRREAQQVIKQLDDAMARNPDRQLAEQLAQMQKAIEGVSERDLGQADRKLDEAQAEEQRAEKAADLAKAQEQQQKAADAMEKIARQLDRIAVEEKVEDLQQATADVAHAQRELQQRVAAIRPDAPADERAAALKDAAQDEKQIADALKQLGQDVQELQKDAQPIIPQAAGTLEQARQQLAAAQQEAQQAIAQAEAGQPPQAAAEMAQAEQRISEARRALRQADDQVAQARQAAEAEVAAVQPDLPQAIRDLARQQQQAAQELQQAMQAPNPDDAAAVERAREKQQEVAREAKALAELANAMAERAEQGPNRDFRAAQDYADAAKALEAFAQKPMTEAEQAMARQNPDALKQAQEKQAEAAKNLQEIADNVQQVEAEHQLHQAAADATQLADEQKKLSRDALRTKPEDRAAVDDLADRQQHLENDARDVAADVKQAREEWKGNEQIQNLLAQADQQAAAIPQQMEQAQ
ncbi:MAG TPA: DUF4175 family protein, partial [Planctomycetota bacterium]|nr:DUF4175 family protein [Planctomycetota bacterium]